ncbi:MAG: ApaLI family restriction endonuclease [Planctomycetaceae bacterium]|jgi:type II restriction enzyme|nr:ApaLI family restriction endonuclease [Planctomycetaceae bacterium]
MPDSSYEIVKHALRKLANDYRIELSSQIDNRVEKMRSDNNSHYLIYRILGISISEGQLIDVYQNKGRFLYKYAGSFLEKAAFICFKNRFPNAKKERVLNTIGQRPKTFEIDCLIEKEAIEIKWRDATTDGDHITKEHTRLQAIKSHGFRPIRVMFYYPNREQAIRIQETLRTTYNGVGGLYYSGDLAWSYVKEKTDIDLLRLFEELADEYEQK